VTTLLGKAPILLKFYRLDPSSGASPDRGRNLQFSAAEIERGPSAQVRIAHVRRDVAELLGIELRSKGSALNARRHVSVYHSGKRVAFLFDELGGGPMVWNRNHRFDGRRLRLQLFDGIIAVQGVSLVVEPHNRDFIGAECAHCLWDPCEPRIAAGILLGDGGDLPDWYSLQFHRVAHDGVGFQLITHKIVKYRAIGWIKRTTVPLASKNSVCHSSAVLSSAAAPASKGTYGAIQRMVIAKLPEAGVFLCRSAPILSKTLCQHRDGPFWAMAQILFLIICYSWLFEFDCLVLPGFIKRRSPDLVRGLVLSAAKTELGSKAEVEIAHVLQDVDELLGIELLSST